MGRKHCENLTGQKMLWSGLIIFEGSADKLLESGDWLCWTKGSTSFSMPLVLQAEWGGLDTTSLNMSSNQDAILSASDQFKMHFMLLRKAGSRDPMSRDSKLQVWDFDSRDLDKTKMCNKISQMRPRHMCYNVFGQFHEQNIEIETTVRLWDILISQLCWCHFDELKK